MNVCVAVISNKNSPLFFKTSNEEELLSFQFRVYGSLDIVEDKIGNSLSKHSHGDKEATSKYLGLLYAIDDHYIYGYVTNTNVKVSAPIDFVVTFHYVQFILVQEDHSTAGDVPKSTAASQTEIQVKKIFETLHDAYLNLVSSPFYVPNTPIDPSTSGCAKKFELVVDDILKRPTSEPVSKF